MSRIKTLRRGTFLIAVSLAAVLTSAVAAPPVPTVTASAGAFDRLSPGNQKIARSLFGAQSRTTLPPGAHPLTLDQIAAAKQRGEGWGNVFKDMKARGLVGDKNLGQVVSRFERRHGPARGPVTTASGRKVGDERHGGRPAWQDGHEGKGDGNGGLGHGRFDSGDHAIVSAASDHGRVGGGHGGGRGK
jgi:hypothetical protein